VTDQAFDTFLRLRNELLELVCDLVGSVLSPIPLEEPQESFRVQRREAWLELLSPGDKEGGTEGLYGEVTLELEAKPCGAEWVLTLLHCTLTSRKHSQVHLYIYI